MRGLRGRVALVTGGGAGIGAAVARRLAEEGAAVAVLDRDSDAAGEVASAITAAGGRALGIGADVSTRDDVERAVDAAVRFGGALQIVVNNAGIIRPAMLHKMAEQAFRDVLDVHLIGSFHVTQAALAHLPDDGSGRIINSTSAAGLVGTIGQANYSAAKAAIIGLTKSSAKELAKRSITVNAVAPLAATAMTETVRTNPKFLEMTLARVPLGRFAEPDEIAGTFAFLASDDAAYITGQVVCVDGGTVI